jgi:hypothetical protein
VGKPFSDKEHACVYLIIDADPSEFLVGEFDELSKRHHKARIVPNCKCQYGSSMFLPKVARTRSAIMTVPQRQFEQN